MKPGLLLNFSLALLLTGCISTKTRVQKAAKDWCMTIRGSQVIPVYPLTEDLQPGDVFLVQVPVDQQQKLYDEDGFLPLDNHIVRLHPTGSVAFYSHSFVDPAQPPRLPHDWISPPDSSQPPWQPAPHVAFPTYSFSVRRGAGLNLAVPVQGVPVGLSLLGSDAADGSVAIKQARTLGVDTVSLYDQLREWASASGHFLVHFGTDPAARRKNYLRVITRVFAAGEMDVSLRSASSQSAGLDVGAPKPVDLLFPQLPDKSLPTAEAVRSNFTNGWATLQKIVSETAAVAKDAAGKFLPGASLKLTAAGAHTVSLKEEFHPPVIVGYLAFDVALHPGGVLGPPIPTHAVLNPSLGLTAELDREPISAIYTKDALQAIYRALRGATNNLQARNAAARLDALHQFIPASFVSYGIATNQPLAVREKPFKKDGPNYLAYHSFSVQLEQSVRTLDLVLAVGEFHFIDRNNQTHAVNGASPVLDQFRRAAADYQQLRDDPKTSEAVRRTSLNAVVQYLQLNTR